MGEVRRKRGKKVKSKENAVTVRKVKKALDVLRGQRVIAKNTEDGFYYAGQSTKPEIYLFLLFFITFLNYYIERLKFQTFLAYWL